MVNEPRRRPDWHDAFIVMPTQAGMYCMNHWIPVFAGMTRGGFRHSPESGNKIMNEKQPCVYLLASKKNGTLYTGVTSNLARRIYKHKHGIIEGFTDRYDVRRLVYYERHGTMESAINREKQIKGWQRRWKIDLIEAGNPGWRDLYKDLA